MANFRARLLPAALIVSVAGNVVTLSGAVDTLVPEADAAELNRDATVRICLTGPQIGAIGAQIVSNACAQLESDLGLTGGSCTAARLQYSTVERTTTDECSSGWIAQTAGRFPGNWVAD